MTRISTAQIPNSSLADLSKAQMTLVEAARQSSAQTKADDLKGYGRQAQTLVSAERLASRAKSFISTADELKTRMQIQDVALGRAAQVVAKLKDDLFQNMSLESGEGVRSQLEEAFAVIKDTMNTNLGGRYLFGGVLNDRPPVTASDLSTMAANPIASSIEQGASPQTMRIEEGRTIEAGLVADDVASPVLASLQRLTLIDDDPVNGPFGGPLTAAQKTAIQGELDALAQAFNGILSAQADNGRLLEDVDAASARQTSQLEALNGAVGDIVNVDLAEVAVRLNQAQFAYQASAGVFSVLRTMSLLDALK
jgi:flagellar hook-associated protein 3 FlgL